MVQRHSGHPPTGKQQWRLSDWLRHIQSYRAHHNNDAIKKASSLAQLTGGDIAAVNGQSCYDNGLLMADFLLGNGLDQEVLSAAVIYSCVRQEALDLNDVEQELGPNVVKLIQGAIRMDAVKELHAQTQSQADHPQTDNIRKMLLAIVDDLRVVFIKLAERLSLLTVPGTLSPNYRQNLAHEAMAIYSPLANRLGAYNLKWLMEDMAFAILNPAMYRYIAKSLKERRIDRELFIEHMIGALQRLAKANHIKAAQVYGRAKHIYGIYCKMQKKQVDFDSIFDNYALRVLVPSVEDCYALLSAVHHAWTPIPEEFDDYIATPKPNGYRSIHTAVTDDNQHTVEIQIRTLEMHEQAETGDAAHWAYKEKVKQPPKDYQAKITWLRQLMDWQKELAEHEASAQELYSQIFHDRVYVFSPQGEVFDLPAGATPLDFAYHVHSEVGHACKGAKVQGKLVPLNTPLKTGDRVEITTSKEGQPSRDWLNPEAGYLKTGKARSKVQQWFRQQAFERNVAEGEAMLKKILKRQNLESKSLQPALDALNLPDRKHLLAAIGRGEVTEMRLVRLLSNVSMEGADDPITPTELSQSHDSKGSDIYSSGIPRLLTQTANCCKPLPGDPILGYVTQAHGISIHHAECRNIQHMRQRRPHRVIEVNWGDKAKHLYPVDLSIQVVEDASHMIREIKNILDQARCPLVNFQWAKGQHDWPLLLITIEVNTKATLDQLIETIRQSPNVIDVWR